MSDKPKRRMISAILCTAVPVLLLLAYWVGENAHLMPKEIAGPIVGLAVGLAVAAAFWAIVFLDNSRNDSWYDDIASSANPPT